MRSIYGKDRKNLDEYLDKCENRDYDIIKCKGDDEEEYLIRSDQRG